MKVLISACVFGEKVRWNATDKFDREILDWAKENKIELIPVCPENELFGTPRKSIKLEQINNEIIGWMGNDDVYPQLVEKASEIVSRYPEVVGFIGISRSPSCGISVGVKSRGSTMKAPMHLAAEFPTTEINSMRKKINRDRFLERIKKFIESE